MSDLADSLRCKLPPRQQAFDDLLLRYNDAHCALNGGRLGGDPSSGVLLMSAVWTPTYRALERLLRVYRTYAAMKLEVGLGSNCQRTDYWHLAQWYLLCRRYPQWPKKRLVQRGRELVEVQPPVKWRVERHDDTDAKIVRAGLTWLDDEWDRSVAGRRLDVDEHGRYVEMGEPERPQAFLPEAA